MTYSSICDIGKIRKINQDHIYASPTPMGALPNVFIVADGMGGHNAGEMASRLAIDYFVEYIQSSEEHGEITDLIKRGIEVANEKVHEHSLKDEEYSGMGTTFLVATFSEKDNKSYIANVGDSRLYSYDGEKLIKVTKDHSLVEEMVHSGEITRQEAKNHPKKNIITRAVGVEDSIRVDTYELDLTHIKLVLLCSDGLTNMVDEDSIVETVKAENIDDACKKLTEQANNNGGYDNISIIIVETGREEGEKLC